MKFSRQARRRPGIDISPLIDVVFQLLLFYAVTTQFVSEDRLKLQLPEAKTAEQEAGQQPKVVEILVSATGEIRINGQLINPAALEGQIRQLIASAPGRALTIRGDRGADYGAVVKVLDAARAAGAKAINMAVVKPPPPRQGARR